MRWPVRLLVSTDTTILKQIILNCLLRQIIEIQVHLDKDECEDLYFLW